MAKLLARSKSLKLFQPANKKENNEESTSGSSTARVTTPTSKGPMTSWLESPVDPALLSQTAKITIFKYPSTSSLHVVRPKTAGETVGRKDWGSMLSTGSPIEITTEDDTFRFPTPLRRPSTANSFVASPRLDGKPLVNGSQDSGIGLAIGSPSDGVFFLDGDRDSEAQGREHGLSRAAGPVRANTTREITTTDDNSRSKLSRWRSLGGLFARRAGPGGSLKGGRANVEPAVEERSRSDTPQRMRGDSNGSSSNQSEVSSPPQGLWRRATTRRTKPKVIHNCPAPPPKGPLLDVDIPEVRMERYSVLFQDVQTLPMRSSSLWSRRQATGDKTKPLPTAALQALDITPGALIRRATEPSSSASSPSYTLFPYASSPGNRSTDRIPHIAQAVRRNPPHLSTLHRPRPVKRHKTSPSALRSPLVVSTPKQQHRLSPAFEADELVPPKGRDYDSENDGLTPTPSSPASPSTPKSITASPPHRQNSWASSHGRDPSWEIVTVKKRYSPGDLFGASATNIAATLNAIAAAGTAPTAPTTTPASAKPSKQETAPAPAKAKAEDDDDDDWINDAPEVIVARSISVTRANSQRKLFVRPTRGSSRAIPPSLSGQQQQPSLVSPASTTGSTATHSLSGSSVATSTSSSTNTSVGVSEGPVSPIERLARLDAKNMDLRREIWGDSRDASSKADEQWKEKKALTPQMCMVEEEENRKSVWGLIETA